MFCFPTQSDGPGCRNPDAQRGRLLSRHAPDRSSGTANGNFQERGPRTTAASSPNWPKYSWRSSSLASSGKRHAKARSGGEVFEGLHGASPFAACLHIQHFGLVHDYLHRLWSIIYDSGSENSSVLDVARGLAAIILTGPIGVVSHHWHGVAQILGSSSHLRSRGFESHLRSRGCPNVQPCRPPRLRTPPTAEETRIRQSRRRTLKRLPSQRGMELRTQVQPLQANVTWQGFREPGTTTWCGSVCAMVICTTTHRTSVSRSSGRGSALIQTFEPLPSLMKVIATT